MQQTLKKSGPNALSNAELQTMMNRLNLEQNVLRLSGSKTKASGRKWAEDELKKNGSKKIGSWMAADMAKTAAKAAAVAAV
jgi:hypothetical protein